MSSRFPRHTTPAPPHGMLHRPGQDSMRPPGPMVSDRWSCTRAPCHSRTISGFPDAFLPSHASASHFWTQHHRLYTEASLSQEARLSPSRRCCSHCHCCPVNTGSAELSSHPESCGKAGPPPSLRQVKKRPYKAEHFCFPPWQKNNRQVSD